MLEDRPGLKDRLEALCAFTAIAIGGVAGVEMVIGAGFDSFMPGDEVREVAPSAYVQVREGFWDTSARVIPLSSTEPYFMGDDYRDYAAYEEQDLVGGSDSVRESYGDAPEMNDLYAEIEALYAENADYARDAAYDSSWQAGEDRYVDEMNVTDDLVEMGQTPGGYADAYANYESDTAAPPTPETLQAIEASAAGTAAPL